MGKEVFVTLWKFITNAPYLKGMTRKTDANVISIENPYGDYYIVKLKPSDGLMWNAGEHAFVRLPGIEELKKEYRLFSIASIQKEEVLMIGTRTGEKKSKFKEAMLSMKPGDPVSIQGPYGWFRIRDDSSPIVMFAGGVGITPIRALIKELAESKSRPINIVYSSNDFYLFDDEIQEIVDRNPSMTLHKTKTREESSKKIEQLAREYGDKGYYYISASPKVIESVSKLLRSNKIAKKRIIDDTFNGY
ncbi:MAG TPA: FAD-dependent oxidoreductase [Candidatus Merdenecus merdavium]|nr:FAD-dependent oxidoreductase [Candidatus Merdenecus merdavium]